MKYALINNEAHEAEPGLIGKCKFCEKATIAKCGDIKIWHWAHRGKRTCDLWWENETEWHRVWKNNFPKESQEVIHYAENDEKHIADVKVLGNLVVEFQYSYITLAERQSREDFYKDIVWIVNGTRRKRDKSQFFNELEYSTRVNVKEAYRLPHYSDTRGLLAEWKNSRGLVFFDFGDETLWCLISQPAINANYIFTIERKILISSLLSSPEVISYSSIVMRWFEFIKNYEIYLLSQRRVSFLSVQPRRIQRSRRL